MGGRGEGVGAGQVTCLLPTEGVSRCHHHGKFHLNSPTGPGRRGVVSQPGASQDPGTGELERTNNIITGGGQI